MLPPGQAYSHVVKFFPYVVLVMLLVQDWKNLSGSADPTLPRSLALCLSALVAGFRISRLLGLSFVDSAGVGIEGSIRNLAVVFLRATTVLGRLILPSHRMLTLWCC